MKSTLMIFFPNPDLKDKWKNNADGDDGFSMAVIFHEKGEKYGAFFMFLKEGSALIEKEGEYWAFFMFLKVDLFVRETAGKWKEVLKEAADLAGWELKNTANGHEAKFIQKIIEEISLQLRSVDFNADEKLVGMETRVKDVVSSLEIDKPEKHSRLWIDDEIKDILANDLGTKATRYIQFRLMGCNFEIVMKGLRKMKELRFLHMSRGIMHTFGGEWKYDNVFPNALQYLHWYWYPFWCLPNTFQANNLVTLKMEWSNIKQLWEGGESKVLNKLKILDLSYSELTTLDLGSSPNLEVLSLRGCRDLVQLDTLNGCRKLKSIDLSNSKLKTIDLRPAVNLELLHLQDCNALVELHMPGKCLNLVSLTLTSSQLRTLHIGQTPNLEYLDLNNCYDLEDLHMADKCLKLTSLNISRSKLKTLDLGLTPNLKKLDLKECKNLVKLHVPIGCLEDLVYLDLSGCLRFTSFLFDERKDASSRRYESIEVGPLAELHLIAKSQETCPLHPDNTLRKFQFECFYKDDPTLTGNLAKLLSFGLCACTNPKTLSGSICGLRRLRKLKLEGYPEAPKDLDQVECLKELCFSMTNMKHLPDSICMMKHLEILRLKDCWSLEKLPEDLGRLKCLQSLTLSSAKIKRLPDSICMLKHLVFLELSDCFYLETLPEDLGQLKCLKTLYLSYAKIEHLPYSICMLKRLRKLTLFRCSSLKTLPKDLGKLERLAGLYLSSSIIKHLPDTICMLKHLKKLVLDDCSLLEKLPEGLDQLERLEQLDLGECKILQDIPIGSICKMKCLKWPSNSQRTILIDPNTMLELIKN
ncbi:unnamed protein product [Lactuca saligna]|uniref:TIR domain-containing protein n=1 Tax=Lactuca saligna TaxID=75948 RepID=A0AA35UX72_LACSI|nr:unnamed protein product [Lactuca saligna]